MTSQQEGSATFAVVGAGEMGRMHARIVDGRTDASVVAIVDPAPQAADFAAAIGAEWFRSTDDLARAVDADAIKVDGVIVALANSLHEPSSVWALQRGIDVFCEKPLAHSLESAQRIVQAAVDGEANLMIGFHLPFHPEVAPWIEQARHEVGQVLGARVWAIRENGVPDREAFLDRRRTGGGPMSDLMGHPLAVLFAVTGRFDLAWVSGTVDPVHAEESNEVEHWASGAAVVAHETGAIRRGAHVAMETSWRTTVVEGDAPQEWGVEIRGTRKSFRILLPFDEGGKPAYPFELGAYVERVRGARPWNEADVDVAMTIQELIAGVYASASEDGHPMSFGPAGPEAL